MLLDLVQQLEQFIPSSAQTTQAKETGERGARTLPVFVATP